MSKDTKTPKREMLELYGLVVIDREIEEMARERREARLLVDQRLDEELQDTFPASDALSVTRGR